MGFICYVRGLRSMMKVDCLGGDGGTNEGQIFRGRYAKKMEKSGGYGGI
jgi:hypothetical protein